MEIKKAKILKSKKDSSIRTLEVEYVTTDKEGKEDFHADTCGGAIHSDLFDSFQELAVHFGLIGEEIPEEEVVSCEKYDRNLVAKLLVTSFSYGGKDEDPGVTLSGYRILKTGRIKGFNVFVKVDENDDSYEHVVHLNNRLRTAKYEIKQYLEGKYAEDPQQELPFGEPVDNGDTSKTTVEVLDAVEGSVFEQEKPKKGRKKKEAVTE